MVQTSFGFDSQNCLCAILNNSYRLDLMITFEKRFLKSSPENATNDSQVMLDESIVHSWGGHGWLSLRVTLAGCAHPRDDARTR